MSAEAHGHHGPYNPRMFSWRMIAIAAGFTFLPLLFRKPAAQPVKAAAVEKSARTYM